MYRCKKYLILFIIALCFFSGCGEKEKYDLQVEYNALVFADVTDYILGQQYYQGKEILLAGTKEGDVRLLWDGKKEEILMRNMPESLLNIETRWWLDSKGNPYVLYRNTVYLLNQEGEILLEARADGTVTGICESASGEIILRINDTDKFVNGLAVLDTETGTIGKIHWLKDIAYCIAKGYAKDVLILDAKGLYDYGISDGSRQYYIEWSGTAYDPQSGTEDIKFVSDNQIEIYTGRDMTVTLSKVSPEESGKTILTYKTTSISSEIKELIVRFNKENPDYYIVIEECPESQDRYTFREKVEIEIAAGHGIGVGMSIFSWCADSSIFSGEEDLSLENMLDILEGLEEDKIFRNGRDSAALVYDWLSSSDTLYGIVDWQAGTCDFTGDTFRRILELAARYGDGEGKGADGYIANRVDISNYRFFAGYDNSIKNSGRVLTGVSGEEKGVHMLGVRTLAINAASENKEGAWQFLCYLLQEEVQEELGTKDVCFYFPVNRQAFDEAGNYWLTQHIGHVLQMAEAPEWDIETDWLTEEQLEDLNDLFANAVFFPWRTEEILAIIEEETALYFDGSKGMEETIDIIQNRVQLYLDEQAGR